jgi:CheY-like chemotaxis protein
MGQAQQKRRAVLIVEDDAELRSLTAALFEDEEMDTISESAEAALAPLLIGGRDVAMIFADVPLRGVMDGIDLARELKMRWPLLPVKTSQSRPPAGGTALSAWASAHCAPTSSRAGR